MKSIDQEIKEPIFTESRDDKIILLKVRLPVKIQKELSIRAIRLGVKRNVYINQILINWLLVGEVQHNTPSEHNGTPRQ